MVMQQELCDKILLINERSHDESRLNIRTSFPAVRILIIKLIRSSEFLIFIIYSTMLC